MRAPETRARDSLSSATNTGLHGESGQRKTGILIFSKRPANALTRCGNSTGCPKTSGAVAVFVRSPKLRKFRACRRPASGAPDRRPSGALHIHPTTTKRPALTEIISLTGSVRMAYAPERVCMETTRFISPLTFHCDILEYRSGI
ncbi:MAG: hypothetical protein UY71_C0015G0005 [Parcubacteria group bacterium GW2011_GWB1_52_7]|nr:MAG: hypothetical protein UY71_C0015G0005 [Parcubacteria group bacterium GW2011_GWB1_52_7]